MQALDGTAWTVRRRWTPRYEGRGLRARLHEWRKRRPSADSGAADGAGCLADLAFESLVGAAILVVVVVLVLWGVPLLLALVDVVLVLIAVVAGALGRLLFRRPWVIEAKSEVGDRVVRHAVGWRGSTDAMDELAAEIAHGRGQVGSPP